MDKTMELYKEIEDNEIELIETKLPCENLKGLYADNMIFIDTSVKNTPLINCILAEELGHYHTSSGNILMQNSFESTKQEKQARDWAVNRLITLDNIIKAFNQGIDNKYDLAEFLEVTEELIDSSIEYFRRKYGISTKYKNYEIFFIPNLCIKKIKNNKI